MQKKAENKLKRYLPLVIKKLFVHYWIKSFLVLFCSSIAYAQDLPISIDDSTDFDIEIIQDTTEVLLDTLSLDAELAEEESKPWSITASGMIRNKQIQNGVDVSGNNSVGTISTDIYHENGFSAGLDISRRMGEINPGYQSTVARIGYTYSASDWLDISGLFTRYRYATDSINPVAGIPNMISVSATAYFAGIFTDITFDRMFGLNTESVSYISLNLMGMMSIADFTIMPIGSVVLTRYQLESKRLINALPAKVKTVTALSLCSIGLSLRYKISEQFSIISTPNLMYTPDKSLSYSDLQFSVSGGIRYSIDW